MKNTYRYYSEYEIAQYVLGLDLPEATKNGIQQYLASDNAAAAKALKWESYFLGFVDAIPAQEPPDAVLDKLHTSLNLGPVITRPISISEPTDHVEPARPQQAARKHIILILAAIALVVIAVLLITAANHETKTNLVQEKIQLNQK